VYNKTSSSSSSSSSSSTTTIYELHSMDCHLVFHFITEHDVLLLLMLIHERFNGTESTLCGELSTFDSTLEMMYILKTVVLLLDGHVSGLSDQYTLVKGLCQNNLNGKFIF
jgi:hypothetical protein